MQIVEVSQRNFDSQNFGNCRLQENNAKVNV